MSDIFLRILDSGQERTFFEKVCANAIMCVLLLLLLTFSILTVQSVEMERFLLFSLMPVHVNAWLMFFMLLLVVPLSGRLHKQKRWWVHVAFYISLVVTSLLILQAVVAYTLMFFEAIDLRYWRAFVHSSLYLFLFWLYMNFVTA